MAGYVKELLRDISLYNIEDVSDYVGTDFHHMRIDLINALESLYKQGQLQHTHILALSMFLTGREKESLFLEVPNAVELLQFCLRQLEYESDYTDEQFIRWALTSRKQYAKLEKSYVQELLAIGDTF